MVVGLNHSRYPNGTAPEDCVVANNAFVRSDRTVRLVQDDEPVDWTMGGECDRWGFGHARSGWDKNWTGRCSDYLPNGVVAPGESSGLIGNAEGRYPEITTDVLGHSRGEQKTIGCVEFPTGMEDGGPLTAADVGPGW